MRRTTTIILAGALMLAGCKDRVSEKMQQAQVVRDRAKQEFLDSALKQAQQELAQTDTLLVAATKRHTTLQNSIKTTPYSKQLERELTEARRVKDSLQVEFDTQCARIKYLHRKQKEQ